MGSVTQITGRKAPPAPDAALSDLSGANKYTVQGPLAEGGMGVVLRAYDRDLRRPVAMKVLREGAGEEQRARFIEEAQVTGQLEHPNIAPIHELGVDGSGRPFFTMKMLRGRTLGVVLDEIRADPALASRYPLPLLLHALVHACDGVMYAHLRGVIHRDLKPGNLMLGECGEVYVMDWGLARIVGVGIPGPAPSGSLGTAPSDSLSAPPPEDPAGPAAPVGSLRHDSSHFITIDGIVAGTPAYMAPEQARGDLEAIGERTDVYGLGGILYELLTLLPPVEGRTDEEFIRNAKEGRIEDPRRRTPHRRPDPRLCRIAMHALAFDPAARPPNVASFKEEVSRYLYDYNVDHTPLPLKDELRHLWQHHPAIASIAILVFIGLLAICAMQLSS